MARNFDGVNDNVDVPGILDATVGTITGWVKADTLPASTDRYICWSYYESGETEPFTTYEKLIFLRSTGIVGAYVYVGAGQQAISTSAVSTGTWAHLAMTFSNADDLGVWFNGTREATTVLAGDSFDYTNPNFRVSPTTGTVGDGETTRSRLDGSVADVRVWNTVLTAPEIQAVMRGAIIRPQQLLLWLPLWGVTSPEPDWSGANAHGTVTEAVRDDHPPGISAIWLAPHPRLVQVAEAAANPAYQPWYHRAPVLAQ